MNNPALVANISIGRTGSVNYNTCNGLFSSWITTTPLPSGLGLSPAVAYNDYVYVVGGASSSVATTVYYARTYPDGTLGPRGVTTPLPVISDLEPAVAYNGYIYFIDANLPGSAPPTATVEYAQLYSNGALGPWTSTTVLEGPWGEPAVANNGYLYTIGGLIDENTPADATSSVFYAAVNSTGSLGAWMATAPLPSKIVSEAAVVNNGYVYSVGGSGNDASDIVTSSVFYAPINSTGSLGVWAATSPLPAPVELEFAVVYNGYLYSIGGSFTSSVAYYAPINSNGTLGTWALTPPLPTSTYWQPSTIYNGYAYSIAGVNNADLVTTTVNYAPLCLTASF
jgi:hypothetical protein